MIYININTPKLMEGHKIPLDYEDREPQLRNQDEDWLCPSWDEPIQDAK